MLIESGRAVAPIPLATHLVTGMTIARFGSEPQKARWLREGGEGELMLTPALVRGATSTTPSSRSPGPRTTARSGC